MIVQRIKKPFSYRFFNRGVIVPRSLWFRFQGTGTHLTIHFCAFLNTLECLDILFPSI